ncbi:MAG: hypothetical protein IJI46_00700 [Erysipelotrichaceae bacterium]|nr:hypothetical protein [Erysipelotrichaceae bacterium]
MIRLKYKLTEEEAVKYYEMIGSNARETKMARAFAIIWFPALLVALLIALKLYRSYIWIGVAVFLSIIWAMFFAPWMFRDVVRTAAQRQMKEKGFVRETIEVIDKDGMLNINGVDKKPGNYIAYYDLFVVAFADDSTLIVPERAFEGDEEKMQQFMKDVVIACGEE